MIGSSGKWENSKNVSGKCNNCENRGKYLPGDTGGWVADLDIGQANQQ